MEMTATSVPEMAEGLCDLLAESASGPGWGMIGTSVPEMAEIAKNSETNSSTANQVKCAVTKGCPTFNAG